MPHFVLMPNGDNADQAFDRGMGIVIQRDVTGLASRNHKLTKLGMASKLSSDFPTIHMDRGRLPGRRKPA
jgi:hypothetical protein